jgi:hypothetical protein
MVETGFFGGEGIGIFRCVRNFVLQFGIHGTPVRRFCFLVLCSPPYHLTTNWRTTGQNKFPPHFKCVPVTIEATHPRMPAIITPPTGRRTPNCPEILPRRPVHRQLGGGGGVPEIS